MASSSQRFLSSLVLTVLLTATAAAEPGSGDGAVPDLRSRKGGSDWPGFLGPGRDGRSPEKLGLRTWPAAGPPVVWSREVGEGYSMPSVALGRLFLFERAGDKARLTALRSETGEELWRREDPIVYEDLYGYSNGPRASPVVDGERVFTFGVDGWLRARRVTDGELLWQVDTAARFGVQQNFFGAGATPVVEGELLIAMIGGSPPQSPGIMSGKVAANGSAVVAFDKRTGAVRYQVGDDLASYASPVVATIGGRRWGFAFARGGLLGFEPKSGAVDFHYPWRAEILESVNAATPVVVGDTVFITETYGPGSSLLRVRPGGVEVIWRDEAKSRERRLASHWSTPIVHAGHLYGSSGRGSGDAVLKCLDLASGETRWSEKGLTRSTLLYVDEHLIVLTEYGRLLLLEATPKRFAPVAEVDLAAPPPPGTPPRPLIRHPAWNAPILAQGYLYVRGKDQLLCLDLAGGSPPAGAPSPSAP